MSVQPVHHVDPTSLSELKNGTVTIASTGVRQPLSATSVPCYDVLCVPNGANAGPVYFGGDNVTTSNGIPVYPAVGATPDSISDNPTNLNQIYIIGTSGDIVRYSYWTSP